MAEEWTGNSKSNWAVLAATGHSDAIRDSWDYYATAPQATQVLVDECDLDKSTPILECCAGGGALAEVLKQNGCNVECWDIIQRDYPLDKVCDFLTQNETFNGNIVMNPPYKYCLEFVEKALDMIPENKSVYAFLKIQFLESKVRRKFFDKGYLKRVNIFTNRVTCAMNGEFEKYKSSAVCYGWFEFSKSNQGVATIKWVN